MRGRLSPLFLVSMRSLSLFLFVVLAAPLGASAQTTTQVFTGDPHSLGVSGEVGGQTATRMPGDDAILWGVDLDEQGDKPCDLTLHWWRENGSPSVRQGWFTTHFSVCGTRYETGGTAAVGHDGDINVPIAEGSASPTLGDAWVAAHGLRTCLNRRDDRIKGIRVFGSTLDQDGAQEVRRAPSLKRDFERANCHEWQATRKCPAGEVLVGVDIHHSGGAIHGLTPKCAAVSFSTRQVVDRD